MKQINPKAIVSALTVVEETKNQEQEWAELGFGCPKCDGYGNVITDDGGRYCECKIAYFTKKRIAECGVPVHLFKTRTLLNYNADGVFSLSDFRLILSYAENYSPENNKGLVLWGNNGTGKSHIAIALTHQLLLRGVTVLYIPALRLFGELRRSFGNDVADSEFEIKQHYLSPNVLVVDDFKIRSDWQREIFEDIISERRDNSGGEHDLGKSTLIITTNRPFRHRSSSTFPQFSEEMGESIQSWLCGMCHDVEFTGDDHRARPKGER